jgi:hypothetical protein
MKRTDAGLQMENWGGVVWSQLSEKEKNQVAGRFVPFIDSCNGVHRTAAWWARQLHMIDSTHGLLCESEKPLLPTMAAFTRMVYRLVNCGVLMI